MTTQCVGPFVLNPFHKFTSPYKWFHKQDESPFNRTRKRFYYMLKGEGLREGIPHFIVADRVRGINRNQTVDTHGRVRQPHLGLLDMDPLTLLSLGRIYASQKMYKSAVDLNAAGKPGLSYVVSAINGIFSVVIGIPISLASTFYSIAMALPKMAVAGLLSLAFAGIVRIFHKEDTSKPVIEPAPPPPPTAQEIAFFKMKDYARTLAQVKREKGLSNGHLPNEIIAKIAVMAAQPDTGEIQIPSNEKLPAAVRTKVRRFALFDGVKSSDIVDRAALYFATHKPQTEVEAEAEEEGALNNFMF